jgi:hypothetical protein
MCKESGIEYADTCQAWQAGYNSPETNWGTCVVTLELYGRVVRSVRVDWLELLQGWKTQMNNIFYMLSSLARRSEYLHIRLFSPFPGF